MRILLLNQNWFAHELRTLGHEVLTCGTRPDLEYHFSTTVITITDLLAQLPRSFTPDRIVWLDHSGPITVLGLEDCPIPCLMYSVDTHHHHLRHSAIATYFDHVCVAQKDLIHHFKGSNTPVSWLPLWASEYVESSDIKKYGAVFVGTLNAKLNPQRVEFFDTIRRMINIEVLEGHFPSIFPHAEIVLNQTVKGDLNFRVFEAMMCGALLLTERTGNGLLELFKDGTHLVTYTPRNAQEAAEKIQNLLSTPSHMRAIAMEGRAEILAKHTAAHRAETLDHILRGLKKRALTPDRHFGAMANLLWLSASAAEKHVEFSNLTSTLAMQSAVRALHEGANPSDEIYSKIINACLRHDILFRDTIGANTISKISEALPHVKVFSLVKLRSLLNSGKVVEARELALELHRDARAEDTFLMAERAVGFLIDQLQMKTNLPPT